LGVSGLVGLRPWPVWGGERGPEREESLSVELESEGVEEEPAAPGLPGMMRSEARFRVAADLPSL